MKRMLQSDSSADQQFSLRSHDQLLPLPTQVVVQEVTENRRNFVQRLGWIGGSALAGIGLYQLSNVLPHRKNVMTPEQQWTRASANRDVRLMIALCEEQRKIPEQYHTFTLRLLNVLGELQAGSFPDAPEWIDYFPILSTLPTGNDKKADGRTNFDEAKSAAHWRQQIAVEGLDRAEQEQQMSVALEYYLPTVQSMRMTREATLDTYESIFDRWSKCEEQLGEPPRSLYEYCRSFDMSISKIPQKDGGTTREQTAEERLRAKTRFEQYSETLLKSGIDWHGAYEEELTRWRPVQH